MRVFVTGGSGFVGGHVIEGLVAAGHEVRAMARSDASAAAVQEFGAQSVRSSLEDVEGAHLRGCDAVIHAAAKVDPAGARADYERINVDGTARLLGAARMAGVRRFVFVSTEAVLFVGKDLVDVDETVAYPKKHRYLYSETKARAEQLCLRANLPDMQVCVVRPRFVWGPRDETILPQLERAVATKTFAWIGDGTNKTSTVHVANLVHGLVLALECGVGGEVYFIADDGKRELRTFLEELALTRGIQLPDRTLPVGVVRVAARLLNGGWHLMRRRDAPPITPLAAGLLSCEVTVCTDKAKRELGYEPVISVEAGLQALRPQLR